MKFFDENYSQEIPTCIKCLRKKNNLKQSDPKKLDFLESLYNEDFIIHCNRRNFLCELNITLTQSIQLSDTSLFTLLLFYNLLK